MSPQTWTSPYIHIKLLFRIWEKGTNELGKWDVSTLFPNMESYIILQIASRKPEQVEYKGKNSIEEFPYLRIALLCLTVEWIL